MENKELEKNAVAVLDEDALENVSGGSRNCDVVFEEAIASAVVYHCGKCGEEIRFAPAEARVITECPSCGNTDAWKAMYEIL